MAWRIYLTNQAIKHLQIIPGKRAIVAAWTRSDRVHFYDLDSGVHLEDREIPEPPNALRSSLEWQTFVGDLTGPDENTYLPYVRAGLTEIYVTEDGLMRLYRRGKNLFLETDGMEFTLDTGSIRRIVDVDMDPSLGTIAVLDGQGRLHLYHQNVYAGCHETGLRIDSELRASVSVTRGGGTIYATDGRRLLQIDSDGRVTQRLDAFYYIGQMTCSRTGSMVITSDMESGVLRVYTGKNLTPTHQRFAIDLTMQASQLQLFNDLPPPGTAISALACHARGVFAFAMAGVIVVTDVTEMDQLPRAPVLL